MGIGCAPVFVVSLDKTPLQRKIELIILKKILNNLPENIAYARTLFLMCDLSDGRA
jgi:hypothetical protein